MDLTNKVKNNSSEKKIFSGEDLKNIKNVPLGSKISLNGDYGTVEGFLYSLGRKNIFLGDEFLSSEELGNMSKMFMKIIHNPKKYPLDFFESYRILENVSREPSPRNKNSELLDYLALRELELHRNKDIFGY